MTKLVSLAALLVACTGSSTYYPSGQPQYASQTQTTTNGPQTSTTTTTYQSSSYQEPAPAPQPEPVAYQPVYQPPPPPQDQRPQCHPRDNREMCIALGVMHDVGRLLYRLEERSCGKAAKALNRYADNHEYEIEVLLSLEETQTRP